MSQKPLEQVQERQNAPQPKPIPQQVQTPKPAPVEAKMAPQAAPQPKPQKMAAAPKEKQFEPLNYSFQDAPTHNDLVVKGSLNAKESIKLAKGQHCVNHPWRNAYALCSVCKFPYCYVDVIEEEGKFYCLNDMKYSMEKQNTDMNPAMNKFSMVSSLIFIVNSIVLGYFMYPQAKFLFTSAISTGIISFILHVSNTYYIPIGNIALAVLGIVAAITVLRRSVYGFIFSLFISFSGLLLVLYEYLYSSVPYLFVSSILLLLSLASLTYSRMSSSQEALEDRFLSPDIEWPKPEAY